MRPFRLFQRCGLLPPFERSHRRPPAHCRSPSWTPPAGRRREIPAPSGRNGASGPGGKPSRDSLSDRREMANLSTSGSFLTRPSGTNSAHYDPTKRTRRWHSCGDGGGASPRTIPDLRLLENRVSCRARLTRTPISSAGRDSWKNYVITRKRKSNGQPATRTQRWRERNPCGVRSERTPRGQATLSETRGLAKSYTAFWVGPPTAPT